jgi:putative adhesin
MKAFCRLSSVLVFLAFVSCAPGGFRDGYFEKTLSVSGKVNLSVETAAGGIFVRSGSDNTVHIKAHIRAHNSFIGGNAEEKIQKLQQNPPIEQQGNTIRITRPSAPDLRNNVTIEYDIVAPAQTQLTTSSGAGNSTINGLALPVEATTGAGTITAEDLAGDVRLRTGAGTVKAKSVGGALEIESGAGSIHVQGEPKRDWRLKAGAGSIQLDVPSGSSFNLDAESGMGKVSVNDSLDLKDATVSSNRVRGKVGGGGPIVEINSGVGSIHVGRSSGPS